MTALFYIFTAHENGESFDKDLNLVCHDTLDFFLHFGIPVGKLHFSPLLTSNQSVLIAEQRTTNLPHNLQQGAASLTT